MVNITKKNGSLQEFSLEKLKGSMAKAGASAEAAGKIANEIAGKIKEGMHTSEIKSMVTSSLQTVNAAWANAYSKYVKGST
ncbi:MAG TPA: ATP cone domain-containing protein [archaeon]|nr:ATP cone domain-containing protein [archaeon]